MEYLSKPQIIAHIEQSLDYSIFDTKWIPCSAKFCVLGARSTGKGALSVFELDSGKLKLVTETERKSAFKCGSFGASSLRRSQIAIGDFEGTLQILDIERLNLHVYQTTAHDGIINCLDAIGGGVSINCGAPEIVTGGRDGCVKLWDQRQGTYPVANMSARKMADDGGTAGGPRDCWAVAFGDSYNNEERVICAGYDNGDVKLFDLRKMDVRWETNINNGVCGIEFDRKDIQMNKMVVTTLEGGLHCFDLRTQHPQRGFTSVVESDAGRSLGTNGCISGTKSTVWCVKHLPQNRDVFVTCGGTGSLRLWLYHYPSQRFKECSDGNNYGVAGTLEMLQAVTISTQPINCFDWCPDHIGLAVCGAFDQTVRVLITTKLNLY